MRWFFFYASCLRCKHYIPFGDDQFYDLGKCRLYPTKTSYQYADRIRQTPTACGIDARNFTLA